MIIHIIKRDGRKVPFNIEKIANAIFKAAQSCGGTDLNTAMDVAAKVCRIFEEENPGCVPTVEEIQDLVEKTLIENVMQRQLRLISFIVTSAHAHEK